MIIDVTGILIINHSSHKRLNGKKAWCELEYPGHKKGCPNYSKCSELPDLEDYFDLTRNHWFCIQEFNLAAHVEKMKQKHPEWSERQCRCVLYWQNGVRNELSDKSRSFIKTMKTTYSVNGDLRFHLIPEAMGLNVMMTMRKIGQPIEIKPVNIVRKISLIGFEGDYFLRNM